MKAFFKSVWLRIALFAKYLRHRNELTHLAAVSETFASLEGLQEKGLILWMHKDHYLLIAEPVAVYVMAYGATFFKSFLYSVVDWQNYKNLQAAYEQERVRLEGEAIRREASQHDRLTMDDLDRIRRNAREQMHEINTDTLPLVKEFDIFIIRDSAPTAVDASVDNGQLVAVGHFDGSKIEMEMWEDIKHNFTTSEK